MQEAPGTDIRSAASLPPLRVSAVVVSKADLVAALRVYVPGLTDITSMDGDRFLLNVAPADSDHQDRREP